MNPAWRPISLTSPIPCSPPSLSRVSPIRPTPPALTFRTPRACFHPPRPNSAGLGDRVLTVCFSEFGRRVAENASLGTDHGTAGPVFVMGTQVQGQMIGRPVDLTNLEKGDLKMQFDFRQVYASILRDWLRVPTDAVLGGPFPGIELVAQN